MSKKSNTVRTSQVTMHELVLPNDTNNLGNVLGGRVMHFMDICAAMSAYKHARTHVVTASIDEMNFLAPAKKGFILILKSSVNYVANSSMEVGVKIESEDPFSGKIKHTASAYLTFVSLNESGKPTEVPDITPETDVEIRRYKEGKARTMKRKKELRSK
tara:strand:+ start:2886 stop:3362 length:477 start_codon:yes stop_codon:yes gene_type:complete